MIASVRPDDDEVERAVAKFDRPCLGLLATREELVAWAEMGTVGPDPIGCELAIRRMIPTKHDPLVRSIASVFARKNRARYRCLDDDDFFSAGRVGLCSAARHFDVRRGIKFSTYATWCIRRSILEVLSKGDYCRDRRDVRPREPRLVPDGAVVARLLGSVPEGRDRAIVVAHFGLDGTPPLTLARIAADRRMDRRTVSRKVRGVLARLRAEAGTMGLAFDDCFEEAS